MSAPQPRLIGLATASPPHTIDQDLAAEVAARMFQGRVFRSVDLKAIFANTGIRTRRTARPLDWYVENQGWPERNAAYLEAAGELFLQAAQKALDQAGVAAGEIGEVVTVSSTGIATPSLEARLHGRLGLSPGVRRVPVFGLGCAGGVSGLALAARLARATPGKPILLVIVELCSLSYRPDDFSKASVISAALFGDGAAAAVVVCDDSAKGRALEAQGEQLWPDTLNIMGWRIDAAGFGVILSAKLPEFIAARLPGAVDGYLAKTGTDRATVDRFVCHPGGTRVLAALEAALGVLPGALDHERGVLADFGNMSAPTVFFVLERVLNADAHPGRLVMSALGPGFTGTLLTLGPAHG
ncbi:MAG TPA: type III polyketide synthase [Caulobacteraceae bacterium]|jgi:alkylresorcinol/alkylpyrone synthase|nr:type III polyketide synthase [Caulobacteraceae bacterium]